eukprot:scaffold7245_cov197-Ochromonas_danica.AAC.1
MGRRRIATILYLIGGAGPTKRPWSGAWVLLVKDIAIKDKRSTMDVCGRLSTTSQRPQCRNADASFAPDASFDPR